MRGSWSWRPAGTRETVPVEMRFLDLFMAALGALVFLAMLLAFLLRFTPAAEAGIVASPDALPSAASSTPLSIVSRTLPSGRAGEPFEFAFAYRGGQGTVSWHLADGEDGLPSGVIFDRLTGSLAGRPTHPGRSRLILTAYDEGGGQDRQVFELLVQPAEDGETREDHGRAGFEAAAVAFALIFWLGSRAGYTRLDRKMTVLEKAWDVGQITVTFRRGPHEEQIIRLPAGLSLYRHRLAAARRLHHFALAIFTILGGWWGWRTWGWW